MTGVTARMPGSADGAPKASRELVVLFLLAATFLVQTWELPWLIIAAAVAPSLAFVIALQRLVPRRPERTLSVAVAFLFGVVVAGLPAAHLNQWLADWLLRWWPLGGEGVEPIIIAPVVEELAKGGAIVLTWWFLGKPENARSGLARGAQVGFGFSLIENTQYLLLAAIQGGWARLPLAMYLRGILGGAHHALFAATTSVGLVLAASLGLSRAWRLVLLALSCAVAQHVVWNALAAPLVTRELCGVGTALVACTATPSVVALLVTTPLIVVAALAPGALLLLVAVRRQGTA